MSAEVFVDTNILFYALTEARDPRHARALEKIRGLWDRPHEAAISVQVLQELHVNLMRKAGLGAAESIGRVSDYLAWTVMDNDRVLLKAAFDAQRRWKLSFWDSLVLAAAQRSGATQLWSEDLTHGQRFGAVQVVNPLL